MANEVTITDTISVINGSLNARTGLTYQVTQTTPGAVQDVINIVHTSATTLSFTGVTAARFVRFKNLDATNYVEIGPDSAGTLIPFLRLLAGQTSLVAVKPGITIKAQANTAAVDLEIFATET